MSFVTAIAPNQGAGPCAARHAVIMEKAHMSAVGIQAVPLGVNELNDKTAHNPALEALLRERIVVLDGAMGTMFQAQKLAEADYRGKMFADHPADLPRVLIASSNFSVF